MRAIVTGLVAFCAVAGAGREAAAGNEWVVLRVERVEVAVARADGSPWDEAGPTGSHARPDLGIRLAANAIAPYLSPVAEDVLTHDFKYPFLVPLEAVPPAGLAIEVFDQDGPEPMRGELLGTIRVTRGDIAHLLASSSRVKTKSDDSVTRLELSATRYRKRLRESVKVSARKRVARFSTGLVAGELIEVRSSRASGLPTIVVGVRGDRLFVGRCTRVVVASSGAIDALDDGGGTGARFDLRVLEPSLAMWTRGTGWAPCDGRRREMRSVAAVLALQTMNGTSLDGAAVQRILQSRYRMGIERCHERLLRTDPMASGRVRLRYTVGPTGGVVKATVKGLDPSFEACVQPLMLKWRFGAPKDADGNPAAEDVEAELVLDAR